MLMRLHSRRILETSSEVEDIIVSELTAPDKVNLIIFLVLNNLKF